jgi:dCMP deaminase
MTWEEYALHIAETVSKKSKDRWRKVGACILRGDNSVAAVGYNGFPTGMPEDWSDRDKRRLYVVHAEQNALRYLRPNEATMAAVTTLPCNDCLKALKSYGITKIVYKESYEYDNSTLTLAEEFGIELKKITLGNLTPE